MNHDEALNEAEEYDYDDIVNSQSESAIPQTAFQEKIEVGISDMSAAEKAKLGGEHIDCNGQILTIVSVKPNVPKITTMGPNGKVVKIDPKLSQTKTSKFYEAKLQVKFDNNMVAYYPLVRYFVDKNDALQKYLSGPLVGKVKVTFDSKGDSVVGKLYRKVLSKMSGIPLKEVPTQFGTTVVPVSGKEEEFAKFAATVTDAQFCNWLIGKKVKIATWWGKNQLTKEPVFRNDIAEIL